MIGQLGQRHCAQHTFLRTLRSARVQAMLNIGVTRFRTPIDYVDRKWARTYLSFETNLETQDASHAPVRVINFSNGGFLIACDKPLKRGEMVQLEMNGLGKVTGRIIWSDKGRAGGTFETAIAANDLVEIIEGEQDAVPVS